VAEHLCRAIGVPCCGVTMDKLHVVPQTVMVDDEYIIVGSANINQRSQDGARDTELAMGSFQPALKNRGGVHGFRMSLWREHVRGAAEPLHVIMTCLTGSRCVGASTGCCWRFDGDFV